MPIISPVVQPSRGALKILLVKTSSLGDVVHNLPVVSDIALHYPDAQIDWLVEESFSVLPKLHPSVDNVITVAVRRWRKNPLSSESRNEISMFRARLRQQSYDFIIDTQGLIKSAILTRLARGVTCGFDSQSAREALAAVCYQRTFFVPRGQHAVERNRQLVGQALGYRTDSPAHYGMTAPDGAHPHWLPDGDYAVLLHATSRDDKLWSEACWVELGRDFQQSGVRCVLPWGSAEEQARSNRLCLQIPGSICPPKMSLADISILLSAAQVVIGVDTGLAHLAAALDKPTIGIYTATNPELTGLYAGKLSVNLGGIQRAPTVDEVVSTLKKLTRSPTF